MLPTENEQDGSPSPDKNSNDIHHGRLVTKLGAYPGVKSGNPGQPASPTPGHLLSAGAPGKCINFQGHQVAVGKLAAQAAGQPSPAPSHRDPGLAVSSEARQDFQGIFPT